MQRVFLIFALLLSFAAAGCTVYTSGGAEVGAVLDNGTVYLGWHLLPKKKTDRELYAVGAEHGQFQSIYLTTNHKVAVKRVVVTFDNGETFEVPEAGTWGKGHRTAQIALPGAPRAIHQVDVFARSSGKHLAKIEIYGLR
jgi:hypothetical protein